MKTLNLLFLISISTFIFINCNTSKTLSEDPETDMQTFLREAMIHGLSKDRVAENVLDKILEDDHFVVKCKICRSVNSGILTYKKQIKTGDMTLEANILTKLMSANSDEQFNGLNELVDKYVAAYFSHLSMTETEINVMKEKLIKQRENSMNGLNPPKGKCAACNGACSIK
jgi:hypothetical protein